MRTLKLSISYNWNKIVPSSLKELDHMVSFELNLMAIEKINSEFVTGKTRTLQYSFRHRTQINNNKLIGMLNGGGHHKENWINYSI